MKFLDLLAEYNADKKRISRLRGIWKADGKDDIAKVVRHTKNYYTGKWDKLLTACVNREQRFLCNRMIKYIDDWSRL